MADPITAAYVAAPMLTTVIGGTVAAGAMGALMGGGTKTPAAPAVAAPTVMPDPNAQAVKDARTRSIAEQIARRGRASTILSDNAGETLGA